MEIILASASARRASILREHGVEPVVMPSDVDETLLPEVEGQSIETIVKYLAHIKARAVYETVREDGRTALILAADTVIYKEGVGIIGKPTNAADAFRILSILRNTSHRVLTGVAMIDLQTGVERQLCDSTTVYFKDYPDVEIYRYIKEEPPFDKSGAYGIQTSWAANVKRVEGSIENVMGLPWHILGLG